ncbi:MAG: hypothetical protein WBE26_00820 [Phycisphaerae bacterium]
MFTRGLAVFLSLAVVSVAHAGALVELEPSVPANPFNPCGYFAPGETVTVKVYLTQDPVDVDHYLRLIQLDFRNSDAALGLPASGTWVATTNHFAFTDAMNQLSNTFKGDTTTPYLELDVANQFLLPGDGSRVEVGQFDVTMPGTEGDYLLDVMNSAATAADEGAQVRFGFSLPTMESITVWRAETGDLTDGTYTLHVINQAMISTVPVDQKSLSRVQKNIAKLTFGTDLGAVGPVALAGLVEVVQLLPNGVLGGDLSASFSFDIANDGGGDPRVLVVKDTRANMSEAWYALRNTGWGVVPAFEVQYRVLPGDIDGNGFVLPNDVSAVNAAIGPCPTGDCPEDLDGNNFVLPNDVSATNANIGPGPAKPSGHECD